MSDAIFLEKWHGCAAFADPLWLIATIEYVALVKKLARKTSIKDKPLSLSMMTYRISCAKCKQRVESLETVMMDSCTATLLASRRDGMVSRSRILY